MSKNVFKIKYEELEQFDFYEEDLIEKNKDKYANSIGLFLIEFSQLEHNIDIEIADLVIDDDQTLGYTIIKNLSISSKIELFYDLSLQKASIMDGDITKLKEIFEKLEEIIELRNKIAHGKWHTLDKDGFIRVGTERKKDDGFIKFKKTKITPEIIEEGIQKMEKITEEIDEFKESFQY